MSEHTEYRVMRSDGRGGREKACVSRVIRERDVADRLLDHMQKMWENTAAFWIETRTVTDWERIPPLTDQKTTALDMGELP